MMILSKMPWAPRLVLFMVLALALAATMSKAEAAFVDTVEVLTPAMAQQDAATVQRVLQNKMVRERLQALGYNPGEVESRLAQLSDADRHALATQIDNLAPAGDSVGLVIGVLLIILLVIVIIKLMGKRIVVS